MFTVQINPCGVEEVSLNSHSEALDDICLVLWPVVRKHLRRLDKELKAIIREVIENSAEDHPSLN